MINIQKNKQTFELAIKKCNQILEDAKHIDKFIYKDIVFNPDASGRNRHTSSKCSDTDILSKVGKVVFDKSGNPPVRNTINLININLKLGKIKINKKCKNLISALEQQSYDKNGEPDKSSGIDHVVDAYRYLCYNQLRQKDRVKIGYAII